MSPAAPPTKNPSSSSILSQINEVKSQITRSQKIWLVTLGIGLTTLGIGVMGIQLPWQERRQSLAAQYNEEKERSELLLAIHRQKNELKTMEEKSLMQGGATTLTGQISQMGAQTGLQIESVAPQPELAVDPYTRYQIEIIATSNLANLLRFLRAVEDHRPLLWVEQMEIGEWVADSAPARIGPTQEDQPQPLQQEKQKVRFLIGAVSRQKSSG